MNDLARKGVSVIEVILSMAMIAIFTMAFFSLFFTTEFATVVAADQEEALNLAAEGIDIVDSIANDNFLNLSDGEFALSRTGNNYSLILNGTESIDNFFTREVLIESVYRNQANQIEEGAQNLDQSTKKITVTVTWIGTMLASKNVVLQKYITDWSGITWTQTTLTDFNGGTLVDTEALESDLAIPDNGKVELAETPGPITFFESANVQEHAKDVYFENDILYAAVGKSNAGFCTIDIEDPNNIEVLDCVNVNGKGVDVVVSGNYAYVGVDSSNRGLAIVDISNPSNLSVVRTVNLGNSATGIDKVGSYVYVSVNRSNGGFISVNVTNPATATIANTINTAAAGTDVRVAGTYAYVSLNNNQLRIYDITNPNSMVLRSTINLGSVGKGVAYENSYIYVVTSDSQNSLKVYNVANPLAPVLVDNYNVGIALNDVGISGDYLFLASDDSQGAATIYDKSNPTDLEFVDEMDVGGKANGIYTTESYIFYAIDTSNQGIAVLSSSTEILAASGEYESAVHDTGAESFNMQSISWLSSDPPGTSLRFQIRTADSALNLATATFVGPDGTDATFYESSPGIIELDPNRLGQRFVQWKAFFESDGNSTPSLEEVIIKYE